MCFHNSITDLFYTLLDFCTHSLTSIVCVFFSEAGGSPRLVPGGSLRSVSGAVGHVFALHQRGGHTGAGAHPHRAQRSAHGQLFLPHDICKHTWVLCGLMSACPLKSISVGLHFQNQTFCSDSVFCISFLTFNGNMKHLNTSTKVKAQNGCPMKRFSLNSLRQKIPRCPLRRLLKREEKDWRRTSQSGEPLHPFLLIVFS